MARLPLGMINQFGSLIYATERPHANKTPRKKERRLTAMNRRPYQSAVAS